MRKPDFFIVGAAKCGTTAMNQYLGEHPEIFMCPWKESHVFGSDLRPSWRPSLERYLSLFKGAEGARRVGEASVWYLYSKRAAAEIKAFCPGASVLAMLRNPVDMIYSLHTQEFFNGNEDIEDFEEALAAEEDRRRGLRVPRSAAWGPEILCYREVARFAEQVERYFSVFGRDRVHVILFDDLQADPGRVYREACRFLGVAESFRPEFRIVNPSKGRRSFALLRFMKSPPSLLRSLYRLLVPSRKLRTRLSSAVHGLNIRQRPRAPMDPELTDRLRAEFAPDVERLGELLGRDLSHWSRPTYAQDAPA